jgi:hypothetical protein
VHPSWRDLVIDELAADAGARRRFLAAAGLDGALLALSSAGGARGERLLPLLVTDADWDALGDRVRFLGGELDARGHARLLDAMTAAITATDRADPGRYREAVALAEQALARAVTLWDRSPQPLDVDLLRSWYALAGRVGAAPPPPALDRTWAALLPASGGLDAPSEIERVEAWLTPSEIERVDVWLALCEVLADHDRPALHRLGFYDRHMALLVGLGDVLGVRLLEHDPPSPAVASALARLARLVPDAVVAGPRGLSEAFTALEPEVEPPPRQEATRDVDRILRDLA